MKIFSFLFRPGTIGRVTPELTLVLDYLIYRYSVADGGRPLPGMALMNLRFRNENDSGSEGGNSGVEGPGMDAVQRRLYCLGSVFLRYFWTRCSHYVSSQDSWQYTVWRGMRQVEKVYRIASFANFIAFLHSGRYRSLLERALRTRLVYARPTASRAISYEYLNRQLVWAEVSEIVLFLLPLINGDAVRRSVQRFLISFNKQQQAQKGADGSSNTSSRYVACPVCGCEDVLLPYAADPCGHRFCYYCLRGSAESDLGFQCPLCLVRVEGIRPASGREE